MTRDIEDELHRLLGVYRRQANKCMAAGACLAASVMVGSALETALLLMVPAFPDEAEATGCIPREKNGTIRPLLSWTLFDLLAVAEAAGWLSTGPDGIGVKLRRRPPLGRSADIVRRVRNLVHPARFARDHLGRGITKRSAQRTMATLDDVIDSMLSRVFAALRAEMEKEGGT
jgi:hypothetical protein